MILNPEHPDILKIIKKTGSSSDVVIVPVIPEYYSDINECLLTVKRKVEECGGKLILGWMLFHQEFIIDAVFHAIWQSSDNDLTDVTPKNPPMEKILFLPDQQLKYENKQVDNIRLNISENPLVDDLIKVSELLFKLMNAGERKFQHGIVHLQGEDSDKRDYLDAFKLGLVAMLDKGLSRNKPCFCKSGRKYKHCHGKDLQMIKD